MPKQEMPKAYEAQMYEDSIYTKWEQSGLFNPDHLCAPSEKIFSIVLPPPNVTGTLHMGHAVMLAIEDLIVRFHRMRGDRTLWVPGTDHAAIATQAKVERLLMEEGIKDPRRYLGRDAFLQRVEQFASQSHDTIVNQAKKMGASLDWSREAYTMDPARSRAVNTVFKMMYNDGLIYRGERLVNWCPRCASTLADDEVEYRQEKTKFYYLKYGPIVIGTARPETKFLDKIVVVHPDDARYRDLVGKEFEVEWIEGPVKAKVIADSVAEKDVGSGAMTITPAHSFVDFDLAKKYGFEIVKIIDEDGRLMQVAGSFAGQDAHEAREKIIEQLARKGLIDHIDDEYVHNLSVCYRCGTSIQPLPKLQWFINVSKPFRFRVSRRSPIEGIKEGEEVTLKQVMAHVVRSGQIQIIPERFTKTYFHWIDNLRDWNISRQIWFGHRVPVWYCQGGKNGVCLSGCKPQVSVTPPLSCQACGTTKLEQDPDTLDTWFSSGLWTFSTLGWPDETRDLNTFHPTSVLETGYDILFFWVARMILMTTYALGEVPFQKVYLHGLVRDEKGRKMSKSLGNVIDPLTMIAKYGADATRLSLTLGSAPGNDSKLSEAKVAGFRNFTNKLWNISRFVLMNVTNDGRVDDTQPLAQHLADRWILSRFYTLSREVTAHVEAYEFSSAGEQLRDFTWGVFADWYLEIVKTRKEQGLQTILLYVLERLLAYWHPFMPFVTEEIWRQMGHETLLMVRAWPAVSQAYDDPSAEQEFAHLQHVVIAIRNIRAQYNVPPKQKVQAVILGSHLKEHASMIKTLAGVESLVFDSSVPSERYASAVVGEARVFVPLKELGKKRVVQPMTPRKNLDGITQYIQTLEAKLSNEEFIAKAPERVVSAMRERLREAREKQETYVRDTTS